jgi:two-component system, sensor histidine kinase RpfC
MNETLALDPALFPRTFHLAKRRPSNGTKTGQLSTPKSTSRWSKLAETGEGEMARNRLIIATLILAYFLFEALVNERLLTLPLITIALFDTFAFALALHVLSHPSGHTRRRIIAMVGDIGTLSVGLHIGGEITACTWPIYLWIIYGNGFRFGLRFLSLSALSATAGFSTVIVVTPFWQSFYNLSFGLLVGLIVLPLYARKLIHDLSVAKQRAEHASLAKSQFLASVSHELRTPLNAVIGLSDLLAGTDLDHEQREMLTSVNSSGRTLCTLIDNLLDYSRLEAGAMPSQSTALSLPDVIADVCCMAQAQAAQKNVSVNLHIAPETPRDVIADGVKVTQVLTNLVSNAVKFTERGHVTIGVCARQTSDDQVRLRFEVCDTGIGIEDAAKEKIFHRFSQAHDKIVDQFGGTGLGLAIVKHIVSLLDGDVGVDSRLGDGSTFWFEIPAGRVMPQDRPTAVTTSDIAYFQGSRDAGLADTIRSSLCGARLCTVKSAADLEAWLDRTNGPENCRVLLLEDDGLGADIEARVQSRGKVTKIIRLGHRSEAILPDPARRQNCFSCLSKLSVGQTLPQALAWIDALHTRKTEKRQPQQETLQPLKVLVAEDNAANQMVIGKILRSAGHDLTLTVNGRDAVDAFARQTFDIVLLDLNMPVMNGFNALDVMRSGVHAKTLPIVAVTADATADTAQRCKAAGFAATLTKPYNSDTILQAMARLTDAARRSDVRQPSQRPKRTDTAVPQRSRPQMISQSGATHVGVSGNRDEDALVDLCQLQQLKALGDAEFVRGVIISFIDETEILLQALDQSAARRDYEDVRRLAHAVKSCAINVGARQLVRECRVLEDPSRRLSDQDISVERMLEVRAAFEACSAVLLADVSARSRAPRQSVGYASSASC